MGISLVGEKIKNTYEIVSLLGKGGFATVYKARHIYLGKDVAMKVLDRELEPEIIKYFMDEGRFLVNLQHPHIIAVRDGGVEEKLGRPFLVVDYAPNGSLRDRHAKGTRLPLTTVIDYVKPIAAALQFAHNQHIIHLDVKPENILIGEHDTILLGDFGLARLLSTSTSLSLNGLQGTLLYMAPEQMKGHPKTASDQYALAVMVYEWLNGAPPFEGKTIPEIVHKQLDEQPPPLYPRIPGVSRAFQKALFRALTKNPEDRYASVQDFADALVAVYEQEQKAVVSPSIALSQRQRAVLPTQLPQQQVVGSAPTASKTIVSRRTIVVLLAGAATIIAGGTIAFAVASNPFFGEDVSPKPKPTPSPRSSTPTETASTTPLAVISSHIYKQHASAVKSLAWSPDGTKIASASLDSTVCVWEAKTGAKIKTVEHQNPVRSVSWSPDGNYIASGDLGKDKVNGLVRVWNTQTFEDVVFSPYKKHTSEVRCVAWAPGGAGSLLASCGDDGAVYVWNPLETTNQGNVWKPLGPVNQESLLSVAWSHPQQGDPLQIAVSDWTGQLYLCNVTSAMLDLSSQSSLSSEQLRQVWNVAWSPIENQFAAVCNDGLLRVWTWSDPHNKFEITFHAAVQSGRTESESAAYAVAWSPDGKYIATGNGSGVVEIWMLANPQYKLRYAKQAGTIWWLAWSPDGKMLASASEDGTVAVVTVQG